MKRKSGRGRKNTEAGECNRRYLNNDYGNFRLNEIFPFSDKDSYGFVRSRLLKREKFIGG